MINAEFVGRTQVWLGLMYCCAQLRLQRTRHTCLHCLVCTALRSGTQPAREELQLVDQACLGWPSLSAALHKGRHDPASHPVTTGLWQDTILFGLSGGVWAGLSVYVVPSMLHCPSLTPVLLGQEGASCRSCMLRPRLPPRHEAVRTVRMQMRTMSGCLLAAVLQQHALLGNISVSLLRVVCVTPSSDLRHTLISNHRFETLIRMIEKENEEVLNLEKEERRKGGGGGGGARLKSTGGARVTVGDAGAGAAGGTAGGSSRKRKAPAAVAALVAGGGSPPLPPPSAVKRARGGAADAGGAGAGSEDGQMDA